MLTTVLGFQKAVNALLALNAYASSHAGAAAPVVCSSCLGCWLDEWCTRLGPGWPDAKSISMLQWEVQAVIFDLDGTLIDYEGSSKAEGDL